MPRAGLTEDRVVEEAQRIADEIGLSRLTLAAVAERLGVRQPSLYKHIHGMTGLRRSIAIRAKNELADTLAHAAVGRSRSDAVESMSHAYRRWALAYPGRYAAAQRAPAAGDEEDETASLAVVQICSDALSGYHLRDDAAIDAIRSMRAALHGFVTLETDGGFGLPVDVDRSFERLVRGIVIALSAWNEESATSSPGRRGC